MAGYYELRTLNNGEFMFNLKAGNHQVILTSQRYKSRQSALDGIESVRKHGVEAARFVRKVAEDGSPYFVLVAVNGQTIGRSEMYSTAGAMENGINSVMRNATSPLSSTETA